MCIENHLPLLQWQYIFQKISEYSDSDHHWNHLIQITSGIIWQLLPTFSRVISKAMSLCLSSNLQRTWKLLANVCQNMLQNFALFLSW